MISVDSFFNLYKVFKDVKFFDHNHSYYYKGIRYTSVTTVLKKYQEFDTEYWALYKALEKSGYAVKKAPSRRYEINDKFYTISQAQKLPLIMTPVIIRAIWKMASNYGVERGSKIHKYLEDGYQNKFPSTSISLLDNYISKTSEYLAPASLEKVVADFDLKIAGQFDALFYNIETKGFELRDYKTDKEISFSNNYQSFKKPLGHLDSCNWNKYQLQLNLYRYMLEKYTDIRISKMVIVHITDTNIVEYDIKPMDAEINLIIDDIKRRSNKVKVTNKGSK